MNDHERDQTSAKDFHLSKKKFLTDKAHGEYVEKFLIELLSNNKEDFECKSERGQWIDTENYCIEVKRKNFHDETILEPSGLTVTKANYWIQAFTAEHENIKLEQGIKVFGAVILDVEMLRDILPSIRNEKEPRGMGDGNRSVCHLSKMEKLFPAMREYAKKFCEERNINWTRAGWMDYSKRRRAKDVQDNNSGSGA
tara:strand:- start:1053 stop:1643 length:591 start_codon:yes stop_codon:yes gene_type:complete